MITTDKTERKGLPLHSGVMMYFPDALLEVAKLSRIGNDQHNAGQPLHWAREKSNDHLDSAARHMLEAGSLDVDGVRHTAKAAWRLLAELQLEIERSQAKNEEIKPEDIQNPAPRRDHRYTPTKLTNFFSANGW
jgi:hypothetical protein